MTTPPYPYSIQQIMDAARRGYRSGVLDQETAAEIIRLTAVPPTGTMHRKAATV